MMLETDPLDVSVTICLTSQPNKDILHTKLMYLKIKQACNTWKGPYALKDLLVLDMKVSLISGRKQTREVVSHEGSYISFLHLSLSLSLSDVVCFILDWTNTHFPSA